MCSFSPKIPIQPNHKNNKIMAKPQRLTLLLALILILGGSALARWIDTSGGAVEVTEVGFQAPDGQSFSALLYRPRQATIDQKAPAVLATHGYINSRETQAGFAIELSRRGFVVLAIDQGGHGFSAPPAFRNSFGAVPGLDYLRSLPFLDTQRIGLEGHSMGAWASRVTALQRPNDYHAIVMEGASLAPVPGLGDFSGSADEPRNLALVYSLYDEFSSMMWQGALPTELNQHPKIKTLFNTEQAVKEGQVYGDVATGSARVFHQPATTHPGDHISPTAILLAVNWLQTALGVESDIAAESHHYLWKELGTLLALVGIAIALFPVTTFVLSLPAFANLRQTLPENAAANGVGWWLSALIAIAVPTALYFWTQNLGQRIIPLNTWWPQQITNGVAFWALVNAGLTTLGLILSSKLSARKDRQPLGLGISPRQLFLSIVAVAIIALAIYGIAALTQAITLTDFRFWVVALKPLASHHVLPFFTYLPFFVIFFLSFSVMLNTSLRVADGGIKPYLVNSTIASVGILILLLVQYAWLWQTHVLLIAEPLLTIVAIQFVPLLFFAAVLCTFCFYLTGRHYVGGVLTGSVITWYVVAGQATQFA